MIKKPNILFVIFLLLSVFTHATEKNRFHVFAHVGPLFNISPWMDKDLYPRTMEIGGGVGYQISRVFTLELNISHNRFNAERKMWLPDIAPSELPIVISYEDSTNVMLNLKIHPCNGKFSPYIIIGGGGEFQKADFHITIIEDNSSFYYEHWLIHWALGMQFHINQKWSCFVEAGSYYYFLDFLKSVNKQMPIKLGMAYRF